MPVIFIEAADGGLSVGAILQKRIPAGPAAYFKQLCKKGRVRLASGRPLGIEEVLPVGSEICLPESRRLLELLAQSSANRLPVTILHESREILLVDKPAGLAVHASRGHEDDNLTGRVVRLLGERGEKFMTAPVHRLDLQTSGPVLFGKGRRACARLGQLFMQRQVEKGYLALVSGQLRGGGRLESSVKAKGRLKQASADYRCLAGNQRATLLAIRLHTGRQHQIRQQLAERKHPLFGDSRYRGPCPVELPRLFLHSSRLAFVDPFSGNSVQVVSPLPSDLADFLALWEINYP